MQAYTLNSILYSNHVLLHITDCYKVQFIAEVTVNSCNPKKRYYKKVSS